LDDTDGAGKRLIPKAPANQNVKMFTVRIPGKVRIMEPRSYPCITSRHQIKNRFICLLSVYLFYFFISGAAIFAAQSPHDLSDEEANIVLNGTTVVYVGILNDQNIERFLEIVRDKEVLRLIISSGGGEINAGMRLGDWVFDNNVDIVIERICASSCANYVFTAGRRKTLNEGAIVAWHGNILQKTGFSNEELRETVTQTFETLSEDVKKELDLETMVARTILQMGEYRVAGIENQARFFEKIGVDEFICRIGNEKYGALDFFTLSVEDMARFGVSNVQASWNYDNVDLTPFHRKGKSIQFIKIDDALD
jgi:hypothetical protein